MSNRKSTWVTQIVFYILLIAIGLLWSHLGSVWYAKVIPFYDSLSYQTDTEGILYTYQSNGWRSLVENSFYIHSINGYLYKIWISILAPILPLSRTVLYVYFIPLHLFALAALFNLIYRKTNSILLSFLGPLLYISTIPFRRLTQGILDQRLDLATASFLLLLWVVALDFIENPTSNRKTIYFGVITGLIFLHRPIIIIQISMAGLMLFLYALWLANRNHNVVFVLKRIGLAILIAFIFLTPWIMFNAKGFYDYYFVNGYDVGRLSLIDALLAYAGYIRYYIGKPTLIIVSIFVAICIWLRGLSQKYLLIVLSLIILPLIPLIISGSGNSPVAQASLAGIGLLPLAFTPKRTYYPAIIFFLTVMTAGVAAWNITILTHAVNSTDPSERYILEQAIFDLSEKYSIKQSPTYLSGLTTAGGGPASLTSIARMDLGIPLHTGYGGSHVSEFGLPAKETSFSEEELNTAITCKLNLIYRRGGILMLIDPLQVNKIQSSLTWPFSHQIASQIGKLAVESDNLSDTGVTIVIDEIPVRFYWIKDDNIPKIQGCPG